MSDAQKHDIPKFASPTEALNTAATMWVATFCHNGSHTLLDARDNYLKTVEQITGEWLDRRLEAGAEARKLMTRLRDCGDASDMLRVQQEWYSGMLQRLAAECSAWVPLATTMMENLSRPITEAQNATPTSDTPPSSDAAAAAEAAKTPRRLPGLASAAVRDANAAHLLAARTARSPEQPQGDAEIH